MHYQINPHRKRRGFSLAELLIVIAIMGVIAAMAITAMTGVNRSSREAAAKRQAQQIASVFGAGEATAAPGFKAATSVATAMDAVGAGSYGGGSNNDLYFQLPGISSTMDNHRPVNEQAIHYLSWTGESLIFEENGVVAPPPVNNSPWFLLIIIPTPGAAGYVAMQDNMHPQDEHRARDLGNGSSAIEWRPKA